MGGTTSGGATRDTVMGAWGRCFWNVCDVRHDNDRSVFISEEEFTCFVATGVSASVVATRQHNRLAQYDGLSSCITFLVDCHSEMNIWHRGTCSGFIFPLLSCQAHLNPSEVRMPAAWIQPPVTSGNYP